MIRLELDSAVDKLGRSAYAALLSRASEANRLLIQKSGAGNQYLGWRDLLQSPNDALIEDIELLAAEIRERADVFICIGIGGSYLGTAAVVHALRPPFTDSSAEGVVEIQFAGHHLSGRYLERLLEHLDGRSVYVNVISKSGTTLEPAVAFRVLRKWMEERFDDAARRIIVTTDPERGKLNVLRGTYGYRRYVIPPSVGGRFSIFTPVGLLPIAVAGVDIRALFYGAVAMLNDLGDNDTNVAADYARYRYLLFEKGFRIESLATFHPELADIGSWWQQLFGESEGKDGTGLFPATMRFTADLHSLGQFVQDGTRILAETFLMLEEEPTDLVVPPGDSNDSLDYLTGTPVANINRQAYEGTKAAHLDGGVPTASIWIPELTAESIGSLLYFFMHAVSVSGYMLGVNPFDQPGVEAYKKEMFRRLGKPS